MQNQELFGGKFELSLKEILSPLLVAIIGGVLFIFGACIAFPAGRVWGLILVLTGIFGLLIAGAYSYTRKSLHYWTR